jgi:NADH-quinone oxidoreductase subunit C
MMDLLTLCENIKAKLPCGIQTATIALDELTVEVKPEALMSLCHLLRDDAAFDFAMLLDVAGIDYLEYGIDHWQTQSATATGFGRGAMNHGINELHHVKPTRFAVVYHLLSLTHNMRLRIRVFVPEHDLKVDSVMPIWPAADWFEREAFDLYGIQFKGHPDLRRLLTDYGFRGHPFRKDFPLSGEVEVRYDAGQKRVIYEPVDIEARILEPKVIRHDHRYLVDKE